MIPAYLYNCLPLFLGHSNSTLNIIQSVHLVAHPASLSIFLFLSDRMLSKTAIMIDEYLNIELGELQTCGGHAIGDTKVVTNRKRPRETHGESHIILVYEAL